MPTPAQSITAAINAYKSAARGGAAEETGTSGAVQQQEEFADLVKGAIQEAVKIGERSEQLSIAGINDKADLNQVVTAVAEAEVTLQTVVTVRDKVIDAYKEILRMPI